MSRWLLFVLIVVLLPTAASASPVEFAAQILYGDDSDIGIGGRLEFSTPDLSDGSRLEFDYNWYFPENPPDGDLTFWEFDANWLHEVGDDGVEGAVGYYLGGGLNFTYSATDFDTAEDQDSFDIGINLVGGVELPFGPVTGIAELRVTIAGSEQYTLGVGLRF